MEGEMEVISTPIPNRGAFCGEPGPSSVTLMVAVSFPGTDGVKVNPTSQDPLAARANGAAGQGVLPPGAAATTWKSAAFVPVSVKPVGLTLSGAELKLNRVEFLVELVVPMAMGPKFTDVKKTNGVAGVITKPVTGTNCGLPAALSVTVKVALLSANPGGVPAVYLIPKKQEAPGGTLAVLVVSKLQLGATVGATNTKLAALAPVSVALVILRAFVAPGF